MQVINSLTWQSIEQIANRADRMRITTGDLFLYSSTDIEVCLILILFTPFSLIMTVYIHISLYIML